MQSGDGLEQPRAADELRRHRREEEQDQADGRDDDQHRAAVALAQKVVDRDGVDAAGDDGELFAEHAQRQPGRGHLNHRQQHPAQPRLVGHAGAADEARRRRVRGDQRHRQHKAAHAAAADEVFAEEIFASLQTRAAVQSEQIDAGQIGQHGSQQRPVNHGKLPPFRAEPARRF